MALLKELIVLGAARFIGAAYAPKFVTNGGTSSLFVKGDGTLDSTVYLTSQDISGKVDKVTSTDNAIVRFDGTSGAVQNSSAKVTDDGDISARNIIVHGSVTSNDTRIISSDNAEDLYIKIGNVIPLVAFPGAIRSSISAAGTINLGSSSVPWNNAYAKKFITDGGTSSQFVKGDGSLDSTTYITQSTFNTNNPDLAAIEALTGTSGALVKTDANTWSLYTLKNLTEASHSGWTSQNADKILIPTMNTISYWNGAYNSSNNSNLAYCNKGAFGTVVTHAHTDYVTNVSWDSTNYLIKLSKGGGTASVIATFGDAVECTYTDNASSLTNPDEDGATLPTTFAVHSYITSLLGSYLPLTGGTLTGALTVPSLNVSGAASFTQSINGNILGNAATASRLLNARTIALTGAVTGSGSFDGSGNLSIATTASSYLTGIDFFAGANGATSPAESLTNGNVYLNATQTKNGSTNNVGSVNITGTGSVTVTLNANGDIIVNGTTYTNNVISHLRLGSSGGTANATSSVTDPYLLLVEGSSYDSLVLLKAGTGISITGVNGIVTITNTGGSGSSSDTKVTLTSTTTNAAYELLFSATADDTTRTEEARKTARLKYNPNTYEFTNGNCIQQYDTVNKCLNFYFT